MHPASLVAPSPISAELAIAHALMRRAYALERSADTLPASAGARALATAVGLRMAVDVVLGLDVVSRPD